MKKVGATYTFAMLSAYVVEAMVQLLNQVKAGPLSGHTINVAIVSSDRQARCLASHYPLMLMFNDYVPEFELSRTLSANVWQKREELGAKHAFNWAAGLPSARNVVLRIQRRA